MAEITSHQSPQTLPGYPNISIVNNINSSEKKDDKKDDKKGKGFSPERAMYVGLELALIHTDLLSGNLNNAGLPIYRTTYLASMVAGIAFGLYKSMTTGQEVGLEQRAEEFQKSKASTKVYMGAWAFLQVPVALEILRRFNMSSMKVGEFVVPNVTNLVPVYYGFGLGTDLSAYAYNNLFPKKQKS